MRLVEDWHTESVFYFFYFKTQQLILSLHIISHLSPSLQGYGEGGHYNEHEGLASTPLFGSGIVGKEI